MDAWYAEVSSASLSLILLLLLWVLWWLLLRAVRGHQPMWHGHLLHAWLHHRYRRCVLVAWHLLHTRLSTWHHAAGAIHTHTEELRVRVAMWHRAAR